MGWTVRTDVSTRHNTPSPTPTLTPLPPLPPPFPHPLATHQHTIITIPLPLPFLQIAVILILSSLPPREEPPGYMLGGVPLCAGDGLDEFEELAALGGGWCYCYVRAVVCGFG